MDISATYEALRHIAATEFGDIVVQATIFYLPTDDPLKLRLHLIDDSFIDIYLSASGRYSYHWDRRVADRNEIYRHDNAPHRRWQHVDTFPYHFHDGAETNVTASHISLEPTVAIRQFCAFARQKLRQESSQNKS